MSKAGSFAPSQVMGWEQTCENFLLENSKLPVWIGCWIVVEKPCVGTQNPVGLWPGDSFDVNCWIRWFVGLTDNGILSSRLRCVDSARMKVCEEI